MRDLLLRAKHLFVAAIGPRSHVMLQRDVRARREPCRRHATRVLLRPPCHHDGDARPSGNSAGTVPGLLASPSLGQVTQQPTHTMAATNKGLAQSNKSRVEANATKKCGNQQAMATAPGMPRDAHTRLRRKAT